MSIKKAFAVAGLAVLTSYVVYGLYNLSVIEDARLEKEAKREKEVAAIIVCLHKAKPMRLNCLESIEP